ncbi:MAG: ParA family partition ATPase [Rhizobiaceae bacterium]
MTGKIITIAQQKGGSGKTTLTANLAVAASQHGLQVGILDTDPQGSLGRWYMQRCEVLGEAAQGLQFGTASAWGARFEAQKMLKTCDLVLIDTPPKMGSDGRPSITAADFVIIPVSPSPLDIWATEPTLELVRAEKVPCCAAVTRCAPRTKMTQEIDAALDTLSVDRLTQRIVNRVIFAEAMQLGKSVLEKSPSGPAAQEIRNLWSEIADRTAQNQE